MNFRELSFAAIREMRDYPEGYDILDAKNQIINEWVSQAEKILEFLNYKDFSGIKFNELEIQSEGLYVSVWSCGYSSSWTTWFIPMQVLSAEDPMFTAKCIGLNQSIRNSTKILIDLRAKVIAEEARYQKLSGELAKLIEEKTKVE